MADVAAAAALLFPEATRVMFALPAAPNGEAYLYASRVGASLMLGWSCLLFWGSQRPVERRGVLLLTVVPVLAGLLGASVVAVQSGFIRMISMLPLWIFYASILPLYVIAYHVAAGVEKSHRPD